MKLKLPKKIEYIENKESYGIKYDWNLICKNYQSLKCPNDVYNPTVTPFNACKWVVNLSDRSAGKTTNWLLIGLIMYLMYGTQTQYIRNGPDEIAPKNIQDLFSTILEYKYIHTLTEGKYNTVVYKSKRWYLAFVEPETGKIIDKDEVHFMFICDVYDGETLKSSYNAPKGDLIIFDEFISMRWVCQFVKFCDLVKTIIRDRRSPLIIMLSNTIDKHSTYFHELEIYDDVLKLKTGDSELITTSRGTNIYVELIGLTGERKRKRKIINELFFGFHNNKLASITGDDWSLDNVQHIPEQGNAYIIISNIYIRHNNKLVRLDIVEHEEIGICCYVHWATYTYHDSIILTLEDIYDNRERYKFGTGKLNKLLTRLRQQHKFYFASNDVGSFFDNYEKEAQNRKY